MDNLAWHTKELHYMSKKEIGSLGCCQDPFPHKARDQTSKLGKLHNTYHEYIEATIQRKTSNKIHSPQIERDSGTGGGANSTYGKVFTSLTH